MSTSSTPQLQIPATLAGALQDKDSSNDDFDVTYFSFVLERMLDECAKGSNEEHKACFAEIAALQMPLVNNFKRSKWDTRYSPVMEGRLEDGTPYFFPDIANFDAAVIKYWGKRATDAKHPVFRARYADVVWDMTKAATGGKPPFEMAQIAIDAYIECGTRFPNTDTAEVRLERALEISLSVRDNIRANTTLLAMVNLLDSTDFPISRLTWLFDLPYRMNGVRFSAEQESKVIRGIESDLHRICGSENPVGLVAKELALRLATYYEKLGQRNEVKRVIRCYGESLYKFAGKAQGHVAMHWLQEAYGIYLKYGLKEEAENFQIAAKEKGDEAKEQLIRNSQIFEIPADEMDEFLSDITKGSLEETLRRIAIIFLPKLDEVGKQLEETQEQAKLLSMIPFAKMGENQVIARAGSIEADREGRMMFQMSDNLRYMAFFLGKALDFTRKKYEFTTKSILPILFQSPLFDPSRTLLFEQAIEAYLGSDYVKTIHILVPQIEHCLRQLLAMLGKPTNKHRRSDLSVMIEKSLNDILEDEPAIQQCLGDDVTFYLRVLLCDPRGTNVRNNLAHGLLKTSDFSRSLSDRLIHVLLLLAQLCDNDREKSAST